MRLHRNGFFGFSDHQPVAVVAVDVVVDVDVVVVVVGYRNASEDFFDDRNGSSDHSDKRKASSVLR